MRNRQKSGHEDNGTNAYHGGVGSGMILIQNEHRQQHQQQQPPPSPDNMLLYGVGGLSSTTTDDADVAAGSIVASNSHSNNGTPMTAIKATASNVDRSHVNSSGVNPMAYHHQTQETSTTASSLSQKQPVIDSAPSSAATANTLHTLNTKSGHPGDLEFFEDLVSEPVLVLGMDISHLDRKTQFLVCASGVFGFSLLYGYLQELISVQLANRKLGLFLAMMQFTGYTILAYFLRNFVYKKQARLQIMERRKNQQQYFETGAAEENHHHEAMMKSSTALSLSPQVPMMLYLGISLLRAVDLGMTNLAMQYINYPAKTLMKSSRVVFTMFFGAIIARKRYHVADYLIVLTMVLGLVLFMHADANSDAVFHHTGVLMLLVSLLCDGAISNMSEKVMKKFGVGQDEFIFRMYSIALIAITFAAAMNGDLQEGIRWLQQPGTYEQVMDRVPLEERAWSVPGKVICITIFSSMGFFGSSCSAAITKNFGALSMSITSTARKATTLFLSFFLFKNVCTGEHLVGIVLFIAALTTKSLRRGRKSSNKGHGRRRHHNNKRRHMNNNKHRQQQLQQIQKQSALMSSSTSALSLSSSSGTGTAAAASAPPLSDTEAGYLSDERMITSSSSPTTVPPESSSSPPTTRISSSLFAKGGGDVGMYAKGFPPPRKNKKASSSSRAITSSNQSTVVQRRGVGRGRGSNYDNHDEAASMMMDGGSGRGKHKARQHASASSTTSTTSSALQNMMGFIKTLSGGGGVVGDSNNHNNNNNNNNGGYSDSVVPHVV